MLLVCLKAAIMLTMCKILELGKVAQHVRCLRTWVQSLEHIRWEEERTGSCKISFDLHTYAVCRGLCMHACMHGQISELT